MAAQPSPSEIELRARAERGDAEALNDLGSLIMEDRSRAAEARELFRRSSEAGSIEGKNNYAVMLLMGIGGPTNEALGRRLRDEAAEAGSLGAIMSLAERYLVGAEGYPLDPARGLAYMTRVAESATPAASYAQWRVAMMHLRGIGTPANAQQAYRWVVKASDGGYTGAMISRAVMLATGEGVAEDHPQARLWYERAALTRQEGWAHALRGLGAMLAMGQGGPVDLGRGFGYLLAAHAGGDEQAGILISELRSRVTPDVERQAVAIAEEWMAAMPPEE